MVINNNDTDRQTLTTGVSTATEAQVVAYLRSLSPGELPFDVFHAVAGITVTPIYEVVPLRVNAAGDVEVLLLQREASDPVWGGLLHTPGTVIRSNDQPGTFDSAVDRIRSELNGVALDRGPVFVESLFHQVRRGRELALVHWATLSAEPGIGTWVPADTLPENLVDTQRAFITAAVQHYLRQSR